MKSKQNVNVHFFWVKWLIASIVLSISFFIFVLFLPYPYYSTGFETISDLQQYAATLDEWVKMENDNVLFPSFNNYYKQKYSETFWNKWKDKLNGFLVSVGVKRKPIFSESFFKNVLIKVTKYRLGQQWVGDFIQKVQLTDNSKVVVFGAVQGAFHSLVRYLKELKELDFIDDNFLIKKKDYYLIFLENVINRSPYTLETLSVVLKLLEKNSENVIYLKGSNELPSVWESHTLRKELEIRCRRVVKSSDEKIPLSSIVNSFLNTLPSALYSSILFPNQEESFYFKFLPASIDRFTKEMLDNLKKISFISNENSNRKSLSAVSLSDDNPSILPFDEKHIKLKAIVRGMRKRLEFWDMDGLYLLPPTEGVITWTVLSAPGEVQRKALNFHYDAFILIESCLHDKLRWIVTLFKRDVFDKKMKIFSTRSYDFFTGEAIK